MEPYHTPASIPEMVREGKFLHILAPMVRYSKYERHGELPIAAAALPNLPTGLLTSAFTLGCRSAFFAKSTAAMFSTRP